MVPLGVFNSGFQLHSCLLVRYQLAISQQEQSRSKMPDHCVIARMFFIITLILVTRRIDLHRHMVLRQFLHRRRMFLAGLLRARRVRWIHRIWVYPLPQHSLEEMLSNRVLNSRWKRHFRVSRRTFEYSFFI